MKSIRILAIALLASCILHPASCIAASPTPTPATPAPTTPAPVPLVAVAKPPTLVTSHSTIAPALLQADLNAVPATPQSLLQLLATFTPLPSGVTPDKIKTVNVVITPAGGANVTVQYLVP